MDERASLVVDGERFEGWTGLRITKALSELADSFAFELRTPRTKRFADQLRQIREGQECKVLLRGQPVIVGYVDDVNYGYSASRRKIQIVGRSKTGQLLDCSSVFKTGRWHKATIAQIAKDLCGPYGIPVTVRTSGNVSIPFPCFSIEQGETVADTLMRAAKLRGVMLNTGTDGGLVIDEPGKTAAPLSLTADNILDADGSRSIRDRFSEIAILSQVTGADVFEGEKAAGPSGRATDPNVALHRPHVMLAEHQATRGDLEKQAAYESNRRAARGQSVQYLVNDWGSRTALWEPGQEVSVDDPELDIRENLLVESVEQTVGDSGPETKITVTRLDAYAAEPIAERERKKWAS